MSLVMSEQEKEKAIQDLVSGLDDSQREAVESTASWTRINAGAGTGKTRVIIHRMGHKILSEGLLPSEMTAITFTKKAAGEIRHRLSTYVKNAQSLQVGTFHSIAFKILKRNWELAGFLNSKPIIADSDEQYEIAERSFSQLNYSIDDMLELFEIPKRSDFRNESTYRKSVAEFEDIINGIQNLKGKEREKYIRKLKMKLIQKALKIIVAWKDNGLTVEETKARPSTEKFYKYVDDLYHNYENFLHENNMIDLAGVISRCVHLFNRFPFVKEQESAKIKHLFVDEFQDTNPIQFDFVMALISVHDKLTVVGDIDQSIYAFRNTHYRLMLDMSKYHEVKDVFLGINRRCTDPILDAAVYLVDMNPRLAPKKLKSGIEGKKPVLNEYMNEFAESSSIINEIKKLEKQGVPLKEIAILFRSSFPMQSIEQAAIKAKIPYQMVGGLKFNERSEVRDVVAYLKLAIDPTSDIALSRIFSKPNRGLGANTLEKLINASREMKKTVPELLYELSEGNLIGRLKDTAKTEAVKLAKHIDELHQRYQEGYGSQELIEYIYNNIGYKDWVLSDDDDNRNKIINGNLHQLYTFSEKTVDPVDLINEMAISETEEIEELDGFYIMTMHASKGLEFDYVFLPAMENSFCPSPLSMDPETELEFHKRNHIFPGSLNEERRLVHVALTRARKQVYISYAKTRKSLNIVKSHPSMFIEELLSEKLLDDKTQFHSEGQKKFVQKFKKTNNFKMNNNQYNKQSNDGMAQRFK